MKDFSFIRLKLAKALFLITIFVSFCFPIIFYYSLNKSVEYSEELFRLYDSAEEPLSYLDYCSFKKGKLSVTGWATSPNGYARFSLVARDSDKFVLMKSIPVYNFNVSNYYKNPNFSRSGFRGSVTIDKNLNKADFYILINDNGRLFKRSFSCEKH